MPISINSTTGIQMIDGVSLTRSQSASVLPGRVLDSGSLLTIKDGVTFDGDTGITITADPSIRFVKGDNVYTNVAVISSTSSWTVPSGVTKGYVIVVGGGSSGSAGTTTGGDTPTATPGTPGGFGGAAASFITLTPANTMPATVGAATGTSTFFGISATGSFSGTPGTSSTGNLLNGNVSTVWPIAAMQANAYGVAKEATNTMLPQQSYNPYLGAPSGTIYTTTNAYRPGAAGLGGSATLTPFRSSTPGGFGLPGAVIVFY